MLRELGQISDTAAGRKGWLQWALTLGQLSVAAAQQEHRDERPGEQGHAGAV